MFSHARRVLIDIAGVLPRILPVSCLLFITSFLAVYSLSFYLTESSGRPSGTLADAPSVSYLGLKDPTVSRDIALDTNLSQNSLQGLIRELENCPDCLLVLPAHALTMNSSGQESWLLVGKHLPGDTTQESTPGQVFTWGRTDETSQLPGLNQLDTTHLGDYEGPGQYSTVSTRTRSLTGRSFALLHPADLTRLSFPPGYGTAQLPASLACTCSADQLATMANTLNGFYQAEGQATRFYAYSPDNNPLPPAQQAVNLSNNLPFLLPVVVLLLLATAANLALWKLFEPSYRLQAFYGATTLALSIRYLLFGVLTLTLPLYLGFALVDTMLRSPGGYTDPPWSAGGGLPLLGLLTLVTLLVSAPGLRAILLFARKDFKP